jgi:broad specificity phosphatase PhoE
MKVYSTRHGESVLNTERRVAGSVDALLSEEGIGQAKELAGKLKDVAIDAIYASPLTRARVTAEIVATAKGIPFRVDDRLMEQNYGVYESGTLDDPDFQKVRNSFALAAPGGESLLRVAQRVYGFLDELKAKHADEAVLIVSHSVICKLIHSYFTNLTDDDFRKFRCGNCEIKEYGIWV